MKNPKLQFSTLALLALLLPVLTGCPDELQIKLEGNSPLVAPEGKVQVNFRVLDSAGNPLPSQLPESAFEILERDRRLSAESRKRIVPEPKHFASYSILLLDVSGSMAQQLPELVGSATRFIRILIPEGTAPDATVHRIAIYAFDGSIQKLADFTTNADDLINTTLSKIRDEQSCRSNGICQDSRTRLNGALIQGIEDLKAAREAGKVSGLDFTAGSVVLFTDGRDTINVPTEETAQVAVEKNKDALNFFSIGLEGADMDEQSKGSLNEFGKNGFVLAGNIQELASKFEAIAESIRNIANSYYQLRYCSPLESNNNKLTIKANYEGMKAEKTLDFNVSRTPAGICSVD